MDNTFEFAKKLKNKEMLSEDDLNNFDAYRFLLYASLSNDENILKKVLKTNTFKFFKLTNKQKCLCFTSFQGMNVGGRWIFPKKEVKYQFRELLDKVMFVFDCSYSDAKSMINNNLVDLEILEYCYEKLIDK